jgi:Holliday junction resolvase-like predicted endonuclease
MAVVAPMPRERVRMMAAVKSGECRRERREWRRSWVEVDIIVSDESSLHRSGVTEVEVRSRMEIAMAKVGLRPR